MPLVLNGATSGSTTIQATDAVTQTITLPNNSGTVLTTASTFAGTGPAFSAYQGSAQTITTSTFIKLQCGTKEFDTNSNYDNATNYRFTPTVAGYYQVNGEIGMANSVAGLQCAIFKNGAAFKGGTSSGSAAGQWANVSSLIYMNGSTDYLEFYVAHLNGNNQNTNAGGYPYCYFQASMVRGA